MFGNAAAAASLVHAGLSAGGLSDHLAGLEACASLSNSGFGISSPTGSTLTESANPLVGLATSSVLAQSRLGSHVSGANSNPTISSNNNHYSNPNTYPNPALGNCHPYQHTSSLYHSNYTSSSAAAASTNLGYQDSISNTFSGLGYTGTNTNHASSTQQRLFSNPSLAASTPSSNTTSESLLSEVNSLNSSLLSTTSSSTNEKDSDFITSKVRKESNYSPQNISSSFLPSSTVKIKSGKINLK